MLKVDHLSKRLAVLACLLSVWTAEAGVDAARLSQAIAARKCGWDLGAEPAATVKDAPAIEYYLMKGIAGRLADAEIAVNDSATEARLMKVAGRTYCLPPKGWVALTPDRRTGSISVMLNGTLFQCGWCDDYCVWAKNGSICVRKTNLQEGVVVRAEGDPLKSRAVGEETAFVVTAKDAQGRILTNGTVTVSADNWGKTTVLKKTKFDLAKGNPFTVRAALAEPGFLRATAVLDGKSGERTATVPYAADGIRPVCPCPADFDRVWADDLALLEKTVPLDARREPIKGHYDGAFDEYAMSFATFCGRRVYAVLAVPKDASPTNRKGLLVMVPGAGSGASFACDARADSINLTLNVVDYLPTDENAAKDYKRLNDWAKKEYDAVGYAHVGWKKSREDLFFRSQLVGMVRAVRWATALPEADKDNVVYFGGSQGGAFGHGLVALSGDTFRRAFLYISAMCDLTRGDVGGPYSWPFVYASCKNDADRAVTRAVAPYFDACNFAARIRCPVRYTLGLEDACCPPPNVMAAYNASASADKAMAFEYDMAHGIRAETFASIYEWLKSPEPKPEWK